jgi:anti-sigma-K factor RskA
LSSEHDELENAVAAYMLGACDEEEAAMVAAHLEGCPGCRELARRLRRVTAAIPLSAEPVPPPARLRARLLAVAAGTAPETLPRGRSLPRRLPRPARNLTWVWLRPVAAVVAVAAAFALGTGLGSGLGRAGPAPQPAAQYAMTGSGDLAGAHARIYDLRAQGLTLIQFGGLPALASGRVYELWLISPAGQATPGGVFVPDADGSHVFLLGRSLAGLKALAVTEEPGPAGSPAPTQQPQLVGAV